MRARQRLWYGAVAVTALCGRFAVAQTLDRRQLERIEQQLRQEGEAVIALADAAAAGETRPPDFAVGWHNDFLKAQAGTFIPFIVTVSRGDREVPGVLLYVRLAPRPQPAAREPPAAVTFEEIYPVDLANGPDPFPISRGFSAPPGEYDLTVVVRERDRGASRSRRPSAAILRRPLHVPNYAGPELTTSTVMLAERVTALARAPDLTGLPDRPYVIGLREVQPRLDPVFARTEELTVVFLVYHPALTGEQHFDLEVEYHFFRTGRAGTSGVSPPGQPVPAVQPGERYVSRTQPQRFNPAVLGPQFEPAAGQPVLAGQSVPLSEFEPGDYRLAITVTDLVAGRTIARQVTFTVTP